MLRSDRGAGPRPGPHRPWRTGIPRRYVMTEDAINNHYGPDLGPAHAAPHAENLATDGLGTAEDLAPGHVHHDAHAWETVEGIAQSRAEGILVRIIRGMRRRATA